MSNALFCLVAQAATLLTILGALLLVQHRVTTKLDAKLDKILGHLNMELDLIKPQPEPKIEIEEAPPVDPRESLFTPAESARFDTDIYLSAIAGIDIEKK